MQIDIEKLTPPPPVNSTVSNAHREAHALLDAERGTTVMRAALVLSLMVSVAATWRVGTKTRVRIRLLRAQCHRKKPHPLTA